MALLTDAAYSCADPGKLGQITRKELRAALVAEVSLVNSLFEKKPESTMPSSADLVMRQLDRSEEHDISKPLLVAALTQAAKLNSKAIDQEAISQLAGTLMAGDQAVPRDQMRSVLEAFDELLELDIEQTQTRHPIIDEVMLTLEKLEEGMLSKSQLLGVMAEIAESHDWSLESLMGLVERVYAPENIDAHGDVSRVSIRESLTKSIPEINALLGGTRLLPKEHTEIDRVMEELEKSLEGEVSEAQLVAAIASVGGKPVDQEKVAEIASGVMLGNQTLSRHQIRFAFSHRAVAICAALGSPKTKNSVIEEVLKDLEAIKSGKLTTQEITQAVERASVKHGISRTKVKPLVEEVLRQAAKDGNGEVPRHALRKALEA